MPTGIQNNYVNVQALNSQGKTISIRKRNSYHVLAQNKDLVTIQPSAGSPSNWVNGATVDFRIEKGVADVIDFMVIRVKLTNGTGGGVVLAPAQLQIQRVDFFLQNGSTLIHSVQGHELYEQNAFLQEMNLKIFVHPCTSLKIMPPLQPQSLMEPQRFYTFLCGLHGWQLACIHLGLMGIF